MDDGDRRGEGLQLRVFGVRDAVIPGWRNGAGLSEDSGRLPLHDRQGGRGRHWYDCNFTSYSA